MSYRTKMTTATISNTRRVSCLGNSDGSIYFIAFANLSITRLSSQNNPQACDIVPCSLAVRLHLKVSNLAHGSRNRTCTPATTKSD